MKAQKPARDEPTRRFGPLVEECARYGISKTVAFELVKQGALETFTIGRKRYVLLNSLNALPEWTTAQTQKQTPPPTSRGRSVPGSDDPFDDLSTRARNALRGAGLLTLDDVHQRALKTGLLGIDNFGDTSRREVFRRLAKNGYDVSPYAEWIYG